MSDAPVVLARFVPYQIKLGVMCLGMVMFTAAAAGAGCVSTGADRSGPPRLGPHNAIPPNTASTTVTRISQGAAPPALRVRLTL